MPASTRRSFLSVSTLVGITAFIIGSAQFSCSSEEDKGTGGRSGTGATGGTSGTGGSGGSTGGTSGTSGTSGTAGAPPGDSGELYTCFASQVANPDPGGSVAAGADCCSGFGTCTATGDVPASLSGSLGHADCTSSLLCAPKDPSSIPSLPNGTLPTCHLTYGTTTYEGRCLPRCFTLGNPAAASLDQGDCSETLATQIGIPFADVICAPCYNPVDATSTGACSQFGDAPVDAAPAAFAECGIWAPDGGTASEPMGYCVPQGLIENVAQDTSQIPQDTCAAGMLCAPKNKVEDPNLCFAKCQNPLGGDSACVPTYLVEAPGSPGEGFSATLGQVSCADGETCTPCISPLPPGEVTGACRN